MGMTATSMGIDFTFDELGKHFFANIEAYKLLAYSYVRNDTVSYRIVFFDYGNTKTNWIPKKGIIECISYKSSKTPATSTSE